jgi:hypothetical protein
MLLGIRKKCRCTVFLKDNGSAKVVFFVQGDSQKIELGFRRHVKITVSNRSYK